MTSPRRAEATYAKLCSPLTFPVKTPDGPRALVSDEPGLFSRGSKARARLV